MKNKNGVTKKIKSIFRLVLAGQLFFVFNSCENNNTYTHGKILYENFCANCHMEDGTGLAEVIPTLVNSDYIILNQEKLPCIIRKGLSGKITVNGRTYDTEMPGTPRLTEFEITNVINYINTAWGNDHEIQKHLDVRKALEKCSD